jgi:hypothetical protein
LRSTVHWQAIGNGNASAGACDASEAGFHPRRSSEASNLLAHTDPHAILVGVNPGEADQLLERIADAREDAPFQELLEMSLSENASLLRRLEDA